MNKLKYKCTECGDSYTEESTDKSGEAECYCGVWNNSLPLKPAKDLKLKEPKAPKVDKKTPPKSPFKKGQTIGKILSFSTGRDLASFGEKIGSIGTVMLIKDNHTNEYDPQTGEEVTNWLPGITSRIVSLEELVKLLKSKEVAWDGDKDEAKENQKKLLKLVSK